MRSFSARRVMKPVDDLPVWSIICFVVPSQYRGQAVARWLLDGAIAYAGVVVLGSVGIAPCCGTRLSLMPGPRREACCARAHARR